jgi:hypothetical protein
MAKWMVLAGVLGVAAGQALAGYQLTLKTVSEGDGKGRQAQGGNSTMVMASEAEKARVEFTEGHGPVAGEGGYLLTKDAGKTFYMVSPKEKTYTKWDMEAMMGLAGAMGGMMKMQISDPKVEMLLDEAGEAILGYPTRHYKFRTAYRMSMSVMGFKNEMTITREEESWTTTRLDISALGAWFSKMPQTQNPEMDKLIQAEKGKMKGLPLKTLAVQTTTDSQGKTTVTKSSMSVTEIKKIGSGDVAFDIPETYKEVSLFQAAGQEEESGEKPAARKRQAPPKFDFGSIMKKAMESAE